MFLDDTRIFVVVNTRCLKNLSKIIPWEVLVMMVLFLTKIKSRDFLTY